MVVHLGEQSRSHASVEDVHGNRHLSLDVRNSPAYGTCVGFTADNPFLRTGVVRGGGEWEDGLAASGPAGRTGKVSSVIGKNLGRWLPGSLLMLKFSYPEVFGGDAYFTRCLTKCSSSVVE